MNDLVNNLNYLGIKYYNIYIYKDEEYDINTFIQLLENSSDCDKLYNYMSVIILYCGVPAVREIFRYFNENNINVSCRQFKSIMKNYT